MAKPKSRESNRRFSLYFKEEDARIFEEVIAYFQKEENHNQLLNKSEAIAYALRSFYDLFLEETEDIPLSVRMAELKGRKNHQLENIEQDLKVLKNQLDRLQYLELTNFHAITKGEDFDVQDLESIHSRMDPKQHELMARIDDVIQEDVSRGQTMKHSH